MITHFVSGPLNSVLNDRRERLKCAERDVLFWGVSLIKGKKASGIQSKFGVYETHLIWD